MTSVVFPAIDVGAWDFDEEAKKIDAREYKITVQQALAYTLSKEAEPDTDYYGGQGSHIISTIENSGGSDIARSKFHKFMEPAAKMIQFWQFEIMSTRIKGNQLTKWQQAMAEVVKDPARFVKHAELRLLVTMSRFTEIQKRYHRYAAEFKSVKHNSHGHSLATTTLELVDQYQHKTTRSDNMVYVFKTESNHLAFYKISMHTQRTTDMMEFLDALLALKNNRLQVQVSARTINIVDDMTVFKIQQMKPIV